ncbi:aldose epimerase family protein [Verrucomicrobiota bacterium]
MSINKRPFGSLKDGTLVDIYTLINNSGLKAEITNFGGIVVSLSVPDRNGEMDDVVLGYDTLEEYVKDDAYFGSLVGRCGNRIANGRFTLSGKEYTLYTGDNQWHLHGGKKGFNKVVWQANPVETEDGPALELKYMSKDGEEGYPGNLDVKAIYTLTDQNGLKLEFTAATDQTTIVNLTHHSYFNLAGAGAGDILGHELMIAADSFTPTDEIQVPTGEIRAVKGTPLDFTEPIEIGARIDEDDEQLKYGYGYDHNWVLNKGECKQIPAARVFELNSGRIMEFFTSEPGVQLYTGNFLNGIMGKDGRKYERRYGLCLEPQHFPDAPNKPDFPSIVLEPGETFKSFVLYKFSAV